MTAVSEKGEFDLAVGGETITFNTSLETLARIEDEAIKLGAIGPEDNYVAAYNALFRTGSARLALAFLRGLCAGAGRPVPAVSARDIDAVVPALCGGFFVACDFRPQEAKGGGRPLDGASNGESGASSDSESSA